MTFDLLPGDWTQERPARPRPHLPGRLFGQLTDPGRTRTLGIATSGPRVDAWMVCPPARRGIRTTAPGSCAEGRFQDRRRLISEARAENHISPPPVMLRMLTSSIPKTCPRPFLRRRIEQGSDPSPRTGAGQWPRADAGGTGRIVCLLSADKLSVGSERARVQPRCAWPGR
jgi:hypothetical protein